MLPHRSSAKYFHFPFPTPAGGAAGAGPQAIIFFALLLLLFIITNRPAILPHTDADKVLERELSELEKLTIMLSVNQARKMQQEIKAEVKTIEDCGMQRLERIAAGGKCNDLWELFKKVS